MLPISQKQIHFIHFLHAVISQLPTLYLYELKKAFFIKKANIFLLNILSSNSYNILECQIEQDVQTSNVDCRQSTAHGRRNLTPVTPPQLEVFGEVPILYHCLIP